MIAIWHHGQVWLWCKVLVDGGMAKVTTLAQDDQWIMHERDPKWFTIEKQVKVGRIGVIRCITMPKFESLTERVSTK